MGGQNVVLQNFILNTVSDWLNVKELTNGSFRYNNLDLYTFIRRRNLQDDDKLPLHTCQLYRFTR